MHNSAEQAAALQADLDTILRWTETWQLPLNLKKCSVLHLGPQKITYTYKLGGIDLIQSEVEKDLGIHVDANLKFHKHSAVVAKKARGILAVIKRTFTCLDAKIVARLYKAIVRPTLEYGNCIWGPFFEGDKNMLEKIQRRATKLVENLRHLPYQERLKQLNIPSLNFRRKRGDMITLFKILSGRIKAEGVVPLGNPNQRTRGHALRLKKQFARKLPRRHHLPIRACNDWNRLPGNVVQARTLNAFKKSLDTLWHNQRFDFE